MTAFSRIIGLIVPGIFAASAWAEPLTWTLAGITFRDGGTASGSFRHDAATNTYSNANITTTVGSVLPGAVYRFTTDNYFGHSTYRVALVTAGSGDLTGTPVLFLIARSDLTASGGTVRLSSIIEDTCGNAVCSTVAGLSRGMMGGSITAPPPGASASAP